MVIVLIFTLITVHVRRPGQHPGQLQDSVITLSSSEVELQSRRRWYLALSLDLLFLLCVTFPQDSGSLCQEVTCFLGGEIHLDCK